MTNNGTVTRPQRSFVSLRQRLYVGVGVLLVGFVGLLGWVNYYNYRDYQRLSETQRRIRSNVLVISDYHEKNGLYPIPGYIGSAVGLVDRLNNYGTLFHPTDAWSRPFLYMSDNDGLHYTLLSAGSDAALEFVGTEYGGDPAVDLIIQDGEWVSYYPGRTDSAATITPNEAERKRLDAVPRSTD